MASEALNFLTRSMGGDPRALVRSQIASLALARFTGEQLLARARDLDLETQFFIIANNDESEQRVTRYQQLLGSFGLPALTVNTDFLRTAAGTLATHIIKGEYGHARMLERDILEAEEEYAQVRNITALRKARAAAGQASPVAAAAA